VALNSGGGIHFECKSLWLPVSADDPPSTKLPREKACEVSYGSTEVKGNAAWSGGGIAWPDVQPEFDRSSVTGNAATIYGPDVSSFPVRIARFNTDTESVIEQNRPVEHRDWWYYQQVLYID
jgi:hypothetical protein